MPSTWDRGSRPPPDTELPGPMPDPRRPRTGPQPPWDRGLDPYFRWALHTDWRGFKVHAGWNRIDADQADIQIIARAQDQAMLRQALASPWLKVSPVYSMAPPGLKEPALHFTAKVARSSASQLLKKPYGLRWELASPLRDAERVALGVAHGTRGASRSETEFRAVNVVAQVIEALPGLDHPQALEAAVAVIDFGCPFLHDRFVAPTREGPQARVAAVWDQGSQPREAGTTAAALKAARGWPWQAPARFNYGRELGPAAIQAMVDRSRQTERPLDERDIYRGIDYLIDYDDARRRIWFATHGSHVLDVAAGRMDPLAPPSAEATDAAGRAPIVFVQLPSLTAADSSGGALSAHVLDGVRYALSVCAEDKPLAVNISYGTYAGPHDGSSLVESALQELLDSKRKNFAIVLAAGNARRERCHAGREVAHERSAVLRCSLPAGDTTDTFVEAWYTAPADGARLQARVRAPNRQWSAWIDPDDEDVLRDDARQGAVVAMLRHDRWVPNGDRSLILLAVAPTAAPADVAGALADPGVWEVEIQLVGGRASTTPPVQLQAWIERDDPGQATPGARAYFVDQLAHDDDNTLSSLATTPLALVAGGFNRSTGQPAAYSSTGPQRRGLDQRLVLAACEDDEAQPTIGAAAVRSGEVIRCNGTSVAAPVLTRRVFNRMAAGPDVEQAQWAGELRRLVKAETGESPALKAPD